MKNLVLLSSVLLLNTPIKENNEIIISDKLNYHLSNSKYEIYGNYKKINNEFLYKNDNKIYIYYDFNLEDNINNIDEYYTSNCSIYYYNDDRLEKHFYNTNSINVKEIKEDIINYINNFTKQTKKKTKSNTASYPVIASGTITNETKPYGYTITRFDVSKYRANDVTSLYFLNYNNEYVCGSAASKNLINGYEDGYNIINGNLSIESYNATYNEREEPLRGGTPLLKDVYPANRVNDVTITSSYSSSLTFGVSTNEGFFVQGNLGHSYSKTITSTNPVFTYTTDPKNTNLAKWSFDFDPVSSNSCIVSYGYIYEMNNKGHQLKEGDVAFAVSSDVYFKKDGYYTKYNSHYVKIINIVFGETKLY